MRFITWVQRKTLRAFPCLDLTAFDALCGSVVWIFDRGVPLLVNNVHHARLEHKLLAKLQVVCSGLGDQLDRAIRRGHMDVVVFGYDHRSGHLLAETEVEGGVGVGGIRGNHAAHRVCGLRHRMIRGCQKEKGFSLMLNV